MEIPTFSSFVEEQTAEGRGRRLKMTSHLPVRKLCQGTF